MLGSKLNMKEIVVTIRRGKIHELTGIGEEDLLAEDGFTVIATFINGNFAKGINLPLSLSELPSSNTDQDTRPCSR